MRRRDSYNCMRRRDSYNWAMWACTEEILTTEHAQKRFLQLSMHRRFSQLSMRRWDSYNWACETVIFNTEQWACTEAIPSTEHAQMRFLQLSMRRWDSYNWACGKEILIIEHAPKRFWQLSILRMRSWRLPTRPMLTGSGKSRWSSSTCLTSVSKLSSYSRKASYNTVSPHWRDENKFGHFRIRRSLQIFIQVSLSVTHMVKLSVCCSNIKNNDTK